MKTMTPAEMRAAHPLLDSNPRRREYEAAKAERGRVDAAAAPAVLTMIPLLAVCEWVKNYSDTFAAVINPPGRQGAGNG
jgi:hypothetical protein